MYCVHVNILLIKHHRHNTSYIVGFPLGWLIPISKNAVNQSISVMFGSRFINFEGVC